MQEEMNARELMEISSLNGATPCDVFDIDELEERLEMASMVDTLCIGNFCAGNGCVGNVNWP